MKRLPGPNHSLRRAWLAGAVCWCATAWGAPAELAGWAEMSREGSTAWVPPGETPATVLLQRLPDQAAEADFKRQVLRWHETLLSAATARPDGVPNLTGGHIERGDWASVMGRVTTPDGVRWWLFMARREQAQVLGLLLEAADAARFERHARAAAEAFHAATAAPPATATATTAVPAAAPVLVGVWTNLPAPAQVTRITRERLLAAAGTGLWVDLRADGSLRYAAKAPRATTAPGLTTVGGQPLLITGGNHLDGRYQEGRWRVENGELVLTFERGRHLDAIDDAAADKSWYGGGGRRYPMQWTADGRLRLAVMPGQWLDPMSRVPDP